MSLKALYPSGIQKQNVNLALKIFSEQNIPALEHISKDNPNIFKDIKGTCMFIDLITKFWKICNVKSAFEGKRFNDEFREAIRKDSNLQITFLKDMSLWLKNWRQIIPISEGLSAQTFQAMIITIDSFLLMIPYLFSKYKIDYILLSKFQNDNLEGRFGMYRQMSGSNYYISFIQLLENERKIRFKNNILLCAQNSEIQLKTLMTVEQSYDSTVSLIPFQGILNLNFSLDEVPQNNLLIITYIGGFTARKVLLDKKCSACSMWLQIDKEIAIDPIYDFIKDLDRGKLTLPTEYVVTTVSIVWFIMLNIINNYKADFLKCQNQVSLLHKLCCPMLQKVDSIPFKVICCCKISLLSKLEKISLISSKIFIANFLKSLNDHVTRNSDGPSQKKLKKLKS